MNLNLIVPIAGKSSRFPNVRPKWMLTHPKGGLMVMEAISQLNLNDFEAIYFVALQEHEDTFNFKKGLEEEFKRLNIFEKSKIILLTESTQSQAETVCKAIEHSNINGFIFIKDSDNSFSANIKPGNQVCYYDLNKSTKINPSNKSYISLDSNLNILNIVEKEVIGPNFSVGGYGFESSKVFCEYVQKLKNTCPTKEIYISNVIFQMLLEGSSFSGTLVDQYNDWGTLEDWNSFKKQFLTLFIDLDGTLVYNSSHLLPPYIGTTSEIEKNTKVLRDLKSTGKVDIILTTSRPEFYRKDTVKQLKKYNIPYDHLLMGLMHSKRVVINDYSPSNPYKSCECINLKRNSEDLEALVKDLL